MKHLKTLAAILVCASFLAGCSSSVKVDDEAANKDSSYTTEAKGDSMDPNDPNSILYRRSVYFDFDSYVIRDEFKPLVGAHSKYLSDNSGRKIVIQGNTDERGGREYNLALGQKRAQAVARSMQLLGVSGNQIETVSFGKEKPKALGHDEASWAENRRADIVYNP